MSGSACHFFVAGSYLKDRVCSIMDTILYLPRNCTFPFLRPVQSCTFPFLRPVQSCHCEMHCEIHLLSMTFTYAHNIIRLYHETSQKRTKDDLYNLCTVTVTTNGAAIQLQWNLDRPYYTGVYLIELAPPQQLGGGCMPTSRFVLLH